MAEYAYASSGAPTVEPLSAAEVKSHIRVDDATDDTLIGDYIEAARNWIEAYTRRQIITASWVCYLDAFPDDTFVKLAYPPLQSITSLKYYDTAGTLQGPWAAANYSVDIASIPGRVHLAYGISWPATRDIPNAVQITFKAGYGDAATSVPEAIRTAMRQLIGHWYERRESVAETKLAEVPQSVERLLWPYRDWRF